MHIAPKNMGCCWCALLLARPFLGAFWMTGQISAQRVIFTFMTKK